jgi:hydrogenase maturation protease
VNILVAGVGNVLRSDDAFGVEVANRLLERPTITDVTVVETGIAGIQLVQELQDGYDAIIVIDTVDRERPPGTVMTIDYEVIDVNALEHNEKYDLLADMHLATPERSLMVARALGVLPLIVKMVAVQPVDVDTMAIGMSGIVENAIDLAIEEVDRCIGSLQLHEST